MISSTIEHDLIAENYEHDLITEKRHLVYYYAKGVTYRNTLYLKKLF